MARDLYHGSAVACLFWSKARVKGAGRPVVVKPIDGGVSQEPTGDNFRGDLCDKEVDCESSPEASLHTRPAKFCARVLIEPGSHPSFDVAKEPGPSKAVGQVAGPKLGFQWVQKLTTKRPHPGPCLRFSGCIRIGWREQSRLRKSVEGIAALHKVAKAVPLATQVVQGRACRSRGGHGLGFYHVGWSATT